MSKHHLSLCSVFYWFHPCGVAVNIVDDHVVTISLTGSIWKFSVWSVYMVFFMFYAVIKMQCLLSCWLLVFSVLEVLAGLTVLVDFMPCLFPLMCTFCVYSDSGKNLVTFLMLKSIQVRQFPRRMALIHADVVGKTTAAWSYLMVLSILGSS